MERQLSEVLENTEIECSLSYNHFIPFKPTSTIIFKKGYIIEATGTFDNGICSCNSFKLIISLYCGITPFQFFVSRPYQFTENIVSIKFPELRVPFDRLPLYLNEDWCEKEIIKYRLEKGV